MRMSDWRSDVCASDLCGRSTTRTTMQLLSLVRTDTTSKWFATSLRPDPLPGELPVRGRPAAGPPERIAPKPRHVAKAGTGSRSGRKVMRGALERKGVVEGKRVTVRVGNGGRLI